MNGSCGRFLRIIGIIRRFWQGEIPMYQKTDTFGVGVRFQGLDLDSIANRISISYG